jgi:hypothetical protein
MYLYNTILHLSRNIFQSFLPLNIKKKIFYTFRRLYVQTLYVRCFYTFRRYTFSIYTFRFIRSDVICSDVIRSVFIRSDVIRSDVIRSVIIRSVGESCISMYSMWRVNVSVWICRVYVVWKISIYTCNDKPINIWNSIISHCPVLMSHLTSVKTQKSVFPGMNRRSLPTFEHFSFAILHSALRTGNVEVWDGGLSWSCWAGGGGGDTYY